MVDADDLMVCLFVPFDELTDEVREQLKVFEPQGPPVRLNLETLWEALHRTPGPVSPYPPNSYSFVWKGPMPPLPSFEWVTQ